MDLMELFLVERRKHDRKQYNATATLLIHNQEYVCTVTDISRGGALLSLDVSFELEIGEILDIQIPFSDGIRHVRKTARVKRFSDISIAIKFLW